MRAASHGGVHVAYDGVGRATFDASLAALRRRGMLALFGAASGAVPPVDPQRLNAGGSLFLTRPTLKHYTATREELLWRSGEILSAIAAGELRRRDRGDLSAGPGGRGLPRTRGTGDDGQAPAHSVTRRPPSGVESCRAPRPPLMLAAVVIPRRAVSVLLTAALVLTTAVTAVAVAAPAGAQGTVYGMDVSGWQHNVNWKKAWAHGARFAYVKATEGTGYRNPYFTQQYDGSYGVGMIRGAYHFARPDLSSGRKQADYFATNGGGWSRDGKTLPGVLDIEWNPYRGGMCYGLSKKHMAGWIRSFSRQYHARTTRWPVIYTAYGWWSRCVGRAGNYSATSPLWIARYSSSAGSLPYAWGYYTWWQTADHGVFPGDQDQFNGGYRQLQRMANG